MKIFKKILIFVSCLNFIFADVNDAMNQFYKDALENPVVSNPATVVQTQSANIISAGGFSTRTRSTTLQPFSFSPPSFKSSCGNIDFYGGAFSYLSNTDQLMSFLQNTLITAAPLIFINAMKAVSPNLAGSIMSFFDSAQKLLNMSSNSCQMGTYLGALGGGYLGGALANSQLASSGNSADALGGTVHNTVNGDNGGNLASNISSYSNVVSQWADTLNGVLNPDASQLNGNQGGILKQISMANGSIIWKGMQQLGNVQCTTCQSSIGMRDLANLIISLTGDVYIAPDPNDPMSIHSYPIDPLIKNVDKLYTGIPIGQNVYDCTSYDPTKPIECFDKSNNSYPTNLLNQGFKEQVMVMIQHLQDHFDKNYALNTDDMQLIAISKIPVYQMAQAMQDAGMTAQIANVLRGYSEFIAYSLTQNLVSEAMTMAHSALSTKNVQNSEQSKLSIIDLSNRINVVQEKLNADGANYATNDVVAMTQKINYLRSYAMAQYSPSMVQKIQFAKAFNNN